MNSQEHYIQASHDSGCPRDQIENFIQAGYVGQPAQLRFHAACRLADLPGGPVRVGMYGTRAGAKTHAIMAQVALDDCQRAPGLKWLYLRNIKKAAAESFEDITNKVLRYTEYSYKEGQVTFPNDSRILIGGYKDESDIDVYLGIEYDGIVAEEAQLLSERKFDLVCGSLRTARDDWRIRLYYGFNPGGIGHGYCKRRFVMPMREKREKETRCFYLTYKDNVFCPPEYAQYLEGLTGDLGKAWRDGDMDIFEGQALPLWRHERHVIQPRELPESWPMWRAVDWGYAKPYCCLWFKKDPDRGRVYVIREAYQELLTDRDQARQIKDMTLPKEKIMFTYADPHTFWERKNVDNVVTTSADQYVAEGVPLVKADDDRLGGKRKIDRVLSDLPDGLPGLLVFDNCTNLIRTLPDLPRDPLKPEDVDTRAEDHAYDTLRYGLTNVQPVQLYEQNKTNPEPNPWLEIKGL